MLWNEYEKERDNQRLQAIEDERWERTLQAGDENDYDPRVVAPLMPTLPTGSYVDSLQVIWDRQRFFDILATFCDDGQLQAIKKNFSYD